MDTKPCPFCGFDDPYFDEIALPEEKSPQFFLVCPECQCEGPTADTEIHAAENWNCRAQ